MPHVYNGSISIYNLKGPEIGSAAAMPKAEYEDFEHFIVSLLDGLKKCPTGRDILHRIGFSGHQCSIYCASDDKDNVASKNPSSMQNDIAASIVPFRPRHENLTVVMKGNQTIQDDYRLQMQRMGEATSFQRTAPELMNVLERARVKFPDPLRQLPPLCGISVRDFGLMLAGQKPMDDKTYYTLCFILYDYLTPGTGCATQVRFMSPARFKADFKGDIEEADTKWYRSERKTAKLVAMAVLGHELIHAWRMMAGRRLVTQGWEEEAMTAGVGPFLNWKLTENCLRKEMKMPLRQKYQTGQCSSEMMQGIMMQMNWSSNPVTTRF
jgi:hypothetical protein